MRRVWRRNFTKLKLLYWQLI